MYDFFLMQANLFIYAPLVHLFLGFGVDKCTMR